MRDDTSYEELREFIDRQVTEEAHLKGQLAEVERQIKEKFGLDSLEDAQAEIERLNPKAQRLEVKFKAERDALKKKYPDQFQK